MERSMSIEENKRIVRRYQDIYNSNNLDALREVMADDVVMPRAMPGMPTRLEGARRVHETTLAGMPDWYTKIEGLIAEGDQVAARITMTGTHTGEFWGFPPTGKKVQFTGIYIVRLANGKSWNIEAKRTPSA